MEPTGRVRLSMAEAVDRAIRTGEHLAVQAGTGTGKSLAYLVPAIRHAVAAGTTVVVSTATIALQRQLIDRDLPRLAAALEPLLGQRPDLRDPQGSAQLPVPAPVAHRAARRRRGPLRGRGGGLADLERAARSSGCTIGPRPPTPETATSWCPG